MIHPKHFAGEMFYPGEINHQSWWEPGVLWNITQVLLSGTSEPPEVDARELPHVPPCQSWACNATQPAYTSMRSKLQQRIIQTQLPEHVLSMFTIDWLAKNFSRSLPLSCPPSPARNLWTMLAKHTVFFRELTIDMGSEPVLHININKRLKQMYVRVQLMLSDVKLFTVI